MPDDILISELSLAPAIDDGAVFPFSQDNGGTDATFKAPMSQMAGKIAETTTYANLQTTSKTLVGAINEAAQSGGSAELIGTASGSIATFNDGGNGIPLKSCEVEIVATQAGSGTPSPSNVRAISGFGSVKVVVSGVNLFNKNSANIVDEKYLESDGTEGTWIEFEISDYIPVIGGSNITISGGTTSGNDPSVCFYDRSKNFISGIKHSSYNYPHTYTVPNNAFYMRESVRKNSVNTLQIELGNQATTYEAYNGTTHTITLPETIYGGELECVGGSGKKTHAYIELGSQDWTLNGTSRFVLTNSIGAKIMSTQQDLADILCTIYPTVKQADLVGRTTPCICGLNWGNGVVIYDPNYTDTTTFKTAMSGVYMSYELATLTTFTTTPESIPTLSGVNNIYADSGDVDLEYFNENADEIFELISVYPYEVSGVLTAGQTSITLSSSLIKSTSTIDVYTSDGTNYNSVSVSDGSVIITFDAQVSNLGVKVRIS